MLELKVNSKSNQCFDFQESWVTAVLVSIRLVFGHWNELKRIFPCAVCAGCLAMAESEAYLREWLRRSCSRPSPQNRNQHLVQSKTHRFSIPAHTKQKQILCFRIAIVRGPVQSCWNTEAGCSVYRSLTEIYKALINICAKYFTEIFPQNKYKHRSHP